jgi:hypothetical protein
MEHWQKPCNPQAVKQDTVTSLGNELADAIVNLRALITNLASCAKPVCANSLATQQGMQSNRPPQATQANEQLLALIEQVNGASQDVRDIIDGLRV